MLQLPKPGKMAFYEWEGYGPPRMRHRPRTVLMNGRDDGQYACALPPPHSAAHNSYEWGWERVRTRSGLFFFFFMNEGPEANLLRSLQSGAVLL